MIQILHRDFKPNSTTDHLLTVQVLDMFERFKPQKIETNQTHYRHIIDLLLSENLTKSVTLFGSDTTQAQKDQFLS